MAFQTRVQNWIADNIDTQECALVKPGSMPTFLRNLTIVVPGSMAALTPKLTGKLDSETGSEAVRTADFLQVQLSAPSTPSAMRVEILSTLLDSVASRKEEAVRLRITSALPDIAGVAEQLPAAAGGQERVVSALLNRLLDPAPAVRATAVRGLGDLCSRAGDETCLRLDANIECNVRTEMMQGIVGRLRDCVIDVREAVCTASSTILLPPLASTGSLVHVVWLPRQTESMCKFLALSTPAEFAGHQSSAACFRTVCPGRVRDLHSCG